MYLLKAAVKAEKEAKAEAKAERKAERKRRRRRRAARKAEVKAKTKSAGGTDADFNSEYMGSFPCAGSTLKHSRDSARVGSCGLDKEAVKAGIKDLAQTVTTARENHPGMNSRKPALLTVQSDGVVVWDKAMKRTAMAHSIDRILYLACDSKLPLVGLVAQNPGTSRSYCHVFKLSQRRRSKQLRTAMRVAFKNRKASKTASVVGEPKIATDSIAEAELGADASNLEGTSG
jgi:hypothetical protein